MQRPSRILVSDVLYAVVVFAVACSLISCGNGGGSSGSATLRWSAPTSFTDGAPLDPQSDLIAYMIYYGTSTHDYSWTLLVANPGKTTIDYKLNLSPGTYYFAVTAVDTRGRMSNFSDEVSKTID